MDRDLSWKRLNSLRKRYYLYILGIATTVHSYGKYRYCNLVEHVRFSQNATGQSRECFQEHTVQERAETFAEVDTEEGLQEEQGCEITTQLQAWW